MSGLTTRDALATALWERECRSADHLTDEPPEVVTGFYEDADALIDSGAVIDAAALADDEAVVDRVCDIAYRGKHLTPSHVQVLLLTVAKALTERSAR